MQSTEQEYKEHIKDLENQIRLLKEQVDFLTRKLYGTKSEKTSVLQIEGQMSLFDEIEANADPGAPEPDLIEVEKHIRKRKHAGRREALVREVPHKKVLHVIDESDRFCETCGSPLVRVQLTLLPVQLTPLIKKLTLLGGKRQANR